MATVGRGADQYTVRFPDGLRDRIKAAAEENSRSMNAEIVATLEEKYPKPVLQDFDDWLEIMGEINRNSEEMHFGYERLRTAEGEYLSALMERLDYLHARNSELIDKIVEKSPPPEDPKLP